MSNNNKGFIKIIIIIGIVIIILSLLKIDLRSIYENETVQANFNFVWEVILIIADWIKYIWISYIKNPAYFVWNRIIIDIIWETLSNINTPVS